MLSKEKMQRLNFLAKKKKQEGLNEQELQEQKLLRQEYLERFRSGMRNHIEGIKIVDQEGNNLTSEKVQEIQEAKGLHQDK